MKFCLSPSVTACPTTSAMPMGPAMSLIPYFPVRRPIRLYQTIRTVETVSWADFAISVPAFLRTGCT